MSSPSVSVVMPAAHAAATIAEALNAIQEQDYPNIVDVVVAVADEETAVAARRPGVAVVQNPTGSTPKGLNLAIAEGTGEVVVRVDAHSFVPPDYVTRVVATLIETGADNVGGMQVPVGRAFWSRAIAGAMSSPAGSGDARYRIGGVAGPVETVYLGTYWRDTITELGGFDESYDRHQDYELNERIRRAGGTIWFEPDLRVDYHPRSSLGELARQYYDYGAWKRAFSRNHRGALLPRQVGPPVLTVALAVSLLASLISPLFLLLPALYLIGIVVAGLLTVGDTGAAAVGVPVALATMHLSWGVGFLAGQTKDR